MFKSKKNKNKEKSKNALDYVKLPEIEMDSSVKRGVWIVLILTIGAISLLSLFEAAGSVGYYLRMALLYALGWGRWAFPLILVALAFLLYKEDTYEIKNSNYIGLFLLIIFLQTGFHLFLEPSFWSEAIELGKGGGYFGYATAFLLYKAVGGIAGWIIVIAFLIISFMLAFNTPLSRLVGSESLLGFLLRPIKHIFAKIMNGDHKNDKNEDSGDYENETDDYSEAEELKVPVGFSAKSLSDSPLAAKSPIGAPSFAVEEKMTIKPAKKVKISLPLALLEDKGGKPTSGDIKKNIEVITDTLSNFGINIEMGDVQVGPTVTQYAFKPADGVKLSRITTLRSDLSLALAAHPLRIEAPIPGKALVGVEMPNQKKAVVSLKEILGDKEMKEDKNPLLLALGKDVSGKNYFDNLAKMPHLIVAGATNSGKSVCLNTIIVSLLYRNNPEDLRFILVDPKRVELTVYNNIPHLLTPVITDVAKTINALKWCTVEMDRRFDALAQKGKRNIQAYNENLKADEEKMPYIVFIIDELADLMVAAKKDVESCIIRLAQMARAVGIHLILATQRPSTDVLTGLIKANMPARIAFAVASGIDSRTILDAMGAEDLLGQGDMLISTPASSQPKRLQGAYLSDGEIKRIVRYLRDHADGDPEYIEEIVAGSGARGGSGGVLANGDNGGDDLLAEAKEIVINSGKASASLLQRRLSVGYARAARILDLLEEAGIIGPSNGAKPREILVGKDDVLGAAGATMAGMSMHRREEFTPPQNYLGEAPESAVVLSDNEINADEEDGDLNQEKLNDIYTADEAEQEQKTYDIADVIEVDVPKVESNDDADADKNTNDDFLNSGKFFSK